MGALLPCMKKPSEEEQKLAAEKAKGIQYERSCRDLLCLTIFLLFWVGMIVIWAIGSSQGDWHRLVYGQDYQGNTCGTGAHVNAKFVTYPRVNEDVLMNAGKTDPRDYKFFGVCVSSCPQEGDLVNTYDGKQSWTTPMNTENVLWHCIPVIRGVVASAQPCVLPANIKDSSDPRCVVKLVEVNSTTREPAQPVLLFDQLNSAAALWGRWFGDVQKAWWVVLVAGIGAAVGLGFLFLVLIKYCAACMVWTVIVLVVSISVTLTLYLYVEAGVITDKQLSKIPSAQVSNLPLGAPNQNADNQLKYKYAAYVMTGISVLIICTVIYLRTTIRDAVAIVRKGANALRALPWMILYPVWSVLWIVGLMFYWVFVAASVYSAGSISTANMTALVQQGAAKEGIPMPPDHVTGDVATLVPNMNMKYLLGYHFFGLLWTIQVIQGVGIVTIAGAVAGWYFRQDARREADATAALTKASNSLSDGSADAGGGDTKPVTAPMVRHPVFSSYWRALRYHLGSVAFGAFLIATVQFIRAVVAYIQRQMHQQIENNRLLKAIFCVIQCCLLCLQKCVELVTRNAFIIVAIKGTSFVTSARAAFSVIKDNLKLLSVVNIIGEAIMFLGRLAVTAGCALIAFGLVNNVPEFSEAGNPNQLTSTWMPVLVSGLFGYAVSAAFFYVFDITVDTILVCFALDTKENGKAVHMDDKAVLGKQEAVEKLNPLGKS